MNHPQPCNYHRCSHPKPSPLRYKAVSSWRGHRFWSSSSFKASWFPSSCFCKSLSSVTLQKTILAISFSPTGLRSFKQQAIGLWISFGRVLGEVFCGKNHVIAMPFGRGSRRWRFFRWKRYRWKVKPLDCWTVEPQKVAELRRNSLARTLPFLYYNIFVEAGGMLKKDLPMCVKGLFGWRINLCVEGMEDLETLRIKLREVSHYGSTLILMDFQMHGRPNMIKNGMEKQVFLCWSIAKWC